MLYKIISKAISIYRNQQFKQAYSDWYRHATIGSPFEIGSINAEIFNEASDKSRITIGHHCWIDGRIVCKSHANVKIGNYVQLNTNTRIQSKERIEIGNYVIIAGDSVITDNNTHCVSPEGRIEHSLRVAPSGIGYPGIGNGWEYSESKPVVIEDVVWIGQNCAILKGVTIGEGSIVARQSVVTKDVPPYTIVAGNPAKVVKEIKKPDYKYYEV